MPTLLDSFRFRAPLSVTYLGAIEYSSSNQINGAINIGAADAEKQIFVVMSVTYASVETFAASTVAGVTVTKFSTDFTSTDARQVGCFVSLPTQSGSQTVDMNFTGDLGSGVAFVYKVLNRSNKSAQHTDADGDSGDNYGGGNNTSITLNATTIPDGGFWLASGIKNNLNAVTWNNGTVDAQVDNLLDNRAWCASRSLVTPSSTPSDVFSWSGDVFCSGASWAFAG